MRLRNLLLLCVVPMVQAGTISLTTPLTLEFNDGTNSASVTGAASDVSVSRSFDFSSTSGWFGNGTLAIPGTYSGGGIDTPSPLGFQFSNLFVTCGMSGGCSNDLNANFSFAFQIVSGFDELAGQPMSSSISFDSFFGGSDNPTAAISIEGSFTDSLSVVSNYFRSFSYLGLGGNSSSRHSSFTNTGVGAFGPSGDLGSVTVSGGIRLSSFSQFTNVSLTNVQYSFQPTVSSVPEPGTMALALGGMVACLWLARRTSAAIELRKSSLPQVVPAHLAAATGRPGTPGGSAGAPEVPHNWMQG